jgi:hypothetical protein
MSDSDASLHLDQQSVESLLDAAYWRKCVPWLSVSRDTVGERLSQGSSGLGVTSVQGCGCGGGGCCGGGGNDGRYATGCSLSVSGGAGDSEASARRSALQSRGFVALPAAKLAGYGVTDAKSIEALHQGVLRLVALGHSPSSVIAYDEAWALAAALTPLVQGFTGGSGQGEQLLPLGDWFSFLKDDARQGGFRGPHRDKPMSGPESFSPNGDADFVTVWVALSDATPDMSCLYFLPRDAPDAAYLGPGDGIAALAPCDYEAVIAQPAEAGGAIVFSHRVIHWGSRPTPGQSPRVAMSFALSRARFERGAYFSDTMLPFPPLALRVALRAAQAIAYSAQAPLAKHALGLDTRTFRAAKALFSAAYADKIEGDVQWQRFLKSR